jgi:hypothetical protein
VRNDGNALGVLEYFFWDALIRRVHDLAQDLAGIVQTINATNNRIFFTMLPLIFLPLHGLLCVHRSASAVR